MDTIFINIDYDDGNQSTYRAILVRQGKTEIRRFSSGSFVDDWHAMCDLLHDELKIKQETGLVMCSSSVDHFFMDGDAYDGAQFFAD